MSTMTAAAIVEQRDAAEARARAELARFAPELAAATCWQVYRTVVDDELLDGRTWSAEAALAYLRNGQRVEPA